MGTGIGDAAGHAKRVECRVQGARQTADVGARGPRSSQGQSRRKVMVDARAAAPRLFPARRTEPAGRAIRVL